MHWALLCSPNYAVTWLKIVLDPKNRHRKHLIWLSVRHVYDHLRWTFTCMYRLLFIIINHMLNFKNYFLNVLLMYCQNTNTSIYRYIKIISQISTNIRHFQLMGIYHLLPHGKYQKHAVLESITNHYIAIKCTPISDTCSVNWINHLPVMP